MLETDHSDVSLQQEVDGDPPPLVALVDRRFAQVGDC